MAVGVDRTVSITDATLATELVVPVSALTTLAFPVDVKEAKAAEREPKRLLVPAPSGGIVFVSLKEALPPGGAVPLAITLVDGTRLAFTVVEPKPGGNWDRNVRVELSLTERVGADHVERLKGQLLEMQSRLDECVGAGADDGLKKLGASILRQDLSKPDVFTVEKRPYRSGIDKQNRLLVETHYVFRLFDITYLVLTLENRDPTKPYVLERAELAVVGAGATSDVRVLVLEQELHTIPPGELSKVVVGFRMPQLEAAQSFTLRLLEKNGSRHFELPNLHL